LKKGKEDYVSVAKGLGTWPEIAGIKRRRKRE